MFENINIIIQFFLIVLLLIVVFFLMRMQKALKKEKRVTKFSIFSIYDRPISFFDKVGDLYQKGIYGLSSVLKKSIVFKKYSNHYEQYVDQTKRIRTDAMDFVAMKFWIGFLAVLLTIVSDVLRLQMIGIFQLFLAFFVGFFIPDIFLKMEQKRRNKQIENDLLKAVIIMNNAFKSGRSIMQAVELVSLEITGPISEEFRKMFIDLTYGLDLELVFDRFSRRVPLEEVKYMASSLVILNKTGGDVIKIFSSIEKGFFDRKKLKEELKSATALSNTVFKILILIPFIIFFMIYLFNPTYFDPLFSSLLGKVLLILILLLYLTYILIVRKITTRKEW